MSIPVTSSEKIKFIRWFLRSYELKKRECTELLKFLADDKHLMENVHFVKYAEYCQKAMIMSTVCTNAVPFQYFKKHVMTVEPGKALHDIRLHRSEDLYIQLNFKNSHVSSHYAAVLEENPYYHEPLDAEFARAAETITEKALKDFERERLLHLVDMALDADDKEWFYELTGKLHHKDYEFPAP